MFDTILTIIFIVALVVGGGYLIVEVSKHAEFNERYMREFERRGGRYRHLTPEDYRAIRKTLYLQDLQMKAYRDMQKAAKRHKKSSCDDDFW